jgi:type II restriction/modification system DNA methylase subunit YeeA
MAFGPMAGRSMTPNQFIRKWSASTLTERAASQSHFNDICHLLGEPSPIEADPEGKWYTFEKGARKTGGGDGWADVWKHRYFAWEYKGKHHDLKAAFAQLQRYAIALENPPILVVSDMDLIEIHTNYTNTVEEITILQLADLQNEEKRKILKCVFSDPEQLRPGTTREKLTEEAATSFALIAQHLHARGHEAQKVAHFINKLVFCMFAEDIGILPPRLLKNLLEKAASRPDRFPGMARSLFVAMRAGGNYGSEFIDWFNGGLFDDEEVLPLDSADLKEALAASALDWSAIEPSIFGTLFERGLDPNQRSQLGAHYTDLRSIMKIVTPVVIAPLTAKWKTVKGEIRSILERSKKARNQQTSNRLYRAAKKMYQNFKAELVQFRVLDAACGSGNFLYLALLGLKDLELQVMQEGEADLDMEQWFPMIDPQNVLGIDINPYAAELARLTIWIGQIQWMLRRGFNVSSNPVLKNLDQIACRDALLNPDGSETEWPHADCIVGNPPFLGDKKMISELGANYVAALRAAYAASGPLGADLVAYWFNKSWRHIESGKTLRAGLVATNSIRGGQNRKVLDAIAAGGCIFNAWSDQEWILEGAAVRVSLVCFSRRNEVAASAIQLDDCPVRKIYANLSPMLDEKSIDLTTAVRLDVNREVSFQGVTKAGSLDIDGATARAWLKLPRNPNGRPNSDVLKPYFNAESLVNRPSDTWIIDFGCELDEAEATFYEAPFQYAQSNVRAERSKNRRGSYRKYWWRFAEARPGMRRGLHGLHRYIATPLVSKYRIFAWLPASVSPANLIVVIARDDDTTFGILHSRFHEAWSLRMGTSLEDRPRYTPSSTFETFPFPNGLSPDIPATAFESDTRAIAIAEAARNLNSLRESWLNPPELVKCAPEVVMGFPERVFPANESAAAFLKTRTLTSLYNQKPAWLVNAHRKLDEAVASAYGWSNDISEADALAALLERNHEHSRGYLQVIPRRGPKREEERPTRKQTRVSRN